MRRARLLVLLATASCAALAACDSLFGIDVYPATDGGATDASTSADVTAEATADATSLDAHTDVTGPDVGADTPLSSPDATTDAAADTSDEAAIDAPDDHQVTQCVPQCNGGDNECVNGQLQSCTSVNGCFKWGTPTSCSGGQTCWGSPGDRNAFCCAGGPDVCAPSCQGLVLDAGGPRVGCGPMGETSCCTTLPVPGGTFYRSYDGVADTDQSSPATVSPFSLDAYEVTVARFRNFIEAWDNGFRPAGGAGIHAYLNAGNGLVDSSGNNQYEPGWDTNWAATVNLGHLLQRGDWDSLLECSGSYQTWTTSPSTNENEPINCVDWYMAYAFCIWDGGFLPSEAEWNYAAAGGGDATGQRVYAWSSPSTSETIDCTYATYGSCSVGPQVAGLLPKGNGRYGQADLTGNEWEWTLDYFASYVSPCTDCAYASDPGTGQRTIRGESFNYTASQLYVATRGNDDPTDVYAFDGFRCARAP